MSRRRWLPNAPIGVGVIVALTLIGLGVLNEYQRDARRAYKGTSQEHGQGVPVSPGVVPQGVAANQEPSRSEERAERDLEAQEGMAQWAMLMFFATVAGVFLLGATLRETREAGRSAAEILTQTKRQADAAEQTLAEARTNAQLELRPYLSVDPVGVNFLIGRQQVIGIVSVANVGKLPAQNVFVEVRMDQQTSREREHFDHIEDDGTLDRVIQPGAYMTQGSKTYLPIEGVNAPNGGYVFVWGIAYYDDGYGNRRHTHFCHRYNTASRHRQATLEMMHRGASLIERDKARYHEHGNGAS